MRLQTEKFSTTLCQAIKFKKAKRETRRALTIEEQATFHERVYLPEFAPYRKLLL